MKIPTGMLLVSSNPSSTNEWEERDKRHDNVDNKSEEEHKNWAKWAKHGVKNEVIAKLKGARLWLIVMHKQTVCRELMNEGSKAIVESVMI